MLLIFTNALTFNEPVHAPIWPLYFFLFKGVSAQQFPYEFPQRSLVYTVAGQMKRALEKEMEPLLAEARGKAPANAEEKEGTTRRSARVKEERKWHDE